MSVTAILGFLGPIFLMILKEFLPQILRKVIGNWLSPPTPSEYAAAKLDEAIATNNLTDLNYINSVIIEKSGQGGLTKEQIKSMMEFADNAEKTVNK